MEKKLIQTSVFCYLFLVAYSIIGSRYIKVDNDYQNAFLEENVFWMIFIFIVGSVLETFLFSFLPFIFLYNRIKTSLIILLSGILFGLAHYSSFEFMIVAIIAGLIFNLNFSKYLKHKGYWYAVFSTIILHLFSNLTVYLYDKLMP